MKYWRMKVLSMDVQNQSSQVMHGRLVAAGKNLSHKTQFYHLSERVGSSNQIN